MSDEKTDHISGDNTADKRSESTSGIVDMLLGKDNQQTVDSETMIFDTQKRVWGALKKGYEYTASN